MPRFKLNLPPEAETEAQKLGAVYDDNEKAWYVPDGKDTGPFAQWLAESDDEHRPHLRAKSCYLAENSMTCPGCEARTPVFAIMLPEGHESLYVGDEPDEDEWEVREQPSMLSFVTLIPEALKTAIASITKRYHLDTGQITEQLYWMNHCEHCDALLEDEDVVEEFESPFSPLTPEAASKITLRHFDIPFEGNAGNSDYSTNMEPEFIAAMKKA